LTDLTCLEVTGKSFIKNSQVITIKKTQNSGKKGYQILQNIQDRLTLQKYVKRPRDSISMKTESENPNETKKNMHIRKEIMLWTYCKWDHYSSK
jgi:hypothetical protein